MVLNTVRASLPPRAQETKAASASVVHDLMHANMLRSTQALFWEGWAKTLVRRVHIHESFLNNTFAAHRGVSTSAQLFRKRQMKHGVSFSCTIHMYSQKAKFYISLIHKETGQAARLPLSSSLLLCCAALRSVAPPHAAAAAL